MKVPTVWASPGCCQVTHVMLQCLAQAEGWWQHQWPARQQGGAVYCVPHTWARMKGFRLGVSLGPAYRKAGVGSCHSRGCASKVIWRWGGVEASQRERVPRGQDSGAREVWGNASCPAKQVACRALQAGQGRGGNAAQEHFCMAHPALLCKPAHRQLGRRDGEPQLGQPAWLRPKLRGRAGAVGGRQSSAFARKRCNYNSTSHARRCCNHCPTTQAPPDNIHPHLHARVVLDLRRHRRRGRGRRRCLRCRRHRGARLFCQLRGVPLGVQKLVQVAPHKVHQGCREQGGRHDQLPQMQNSAHACCMQTHHFNPSSRAAPSSRCHSAYTALDRKPTLPHLCSWVHSE